jgi:hypothetical protein
MKTLDNSNTDRAKDQVKDIKFWGDGDTFKLLSKASSVAEMWMKSTKAMEIPGVGCVVQVTTQQGSGLNVPDNQEVLWHVAEALTYVPGVRIHTDYDQLENAVGRHLVPIE